MMKNKVLVLCGMTSALGAASAQAQQQQAQRDTLRFRTDAVIVASTRTGRRIEDEPIRVEVVGREEIEEKLLMTPGDIAMLLNETGGVRIQATAPALGGAAVRIQGLRGRYTQILADGLPLYGEAAGLGPLQIPPMDLGQVEVIKGAASALYGAEALGGVINLISRQPDGEREALANVTTRGGADAVAWLASEAESKLGWTALGSGHRQPRVDIDDDGWADMPSYTRGVARPRLFWRTGETAVLFSAGALAEERAGGGTSSTTEHGLQTTRIDAGVVASTFAGSNRVSVRAAAMSQQHDHQFGGRRERDEHRTAFAEASFSGAWRSHTWLLGAALQHDGYTNDDVTGFDENTTSPGLFAQEEWTPSEWFALSASARVDHVSDHGTLFSPRLSLLLRPAAWTIRLSAGGGHHVPSHWIEDIDAIGLAALTGPAALDVERARAASLDIGRSLGEIELNGTLFGSIIDDAVALIGEAAGTTRVDNVPGETRTWGGELLARAHIEPIHATLSYAHVRATEPNPDAPLSRRDVALTPRHTLGLVVMHESEARGRIGFEAYYTGRQALYDNPYRDVSRPYLLLGVLAERHFGRARVFVNFENITDVRQTRHDPLLLPTALQSGRRTTEAWAPLDGRVINGGVRLSF